MTTNRILGIDIGTSTIKTSERWTTGEVITSRVQQTPTKPLEILRLIDHITKTTTSDYIALSTFRRALVVDDDNLIFARSSPARAVVKPESAGVIDADNPLAPIHRWVATPHSAKTRFSTFDVWLSERLTGLRTCAESQAWLTGLWDTHAGMWDERARTAASVPSIDLPDVLSEARLVGGVCLPIVGDHESTALACASEGAWPLRVAECGTALACMIGGEEVPPTGLGLESPTRCGYIELVDPHFARRVAGIRAPVPNWLTTNSDPSAADVIAAAFDRDNRSGSVVLLCGGSVSAHLIDELSNRGVKVTFNATLNSSVGALILGEAVLRKEGLV
jgi:hypothetical protein